MPHVTFSSAFFNSLKNRHLGTIPMCSEYGLSNFLNPVSIILILSLCYCLMILIKLVKVWSNEDKKTSATKLVSIFSLNYERLKDLQCHAFEQQKPKTSQFQKKREYSPLSPIDNVMEDEEDECLLTSAPPKRITKKPKRIKQPSNRVAKKRTPTTAPPPKEVKVVKAISKPTMKLLDTDDYLIEQEDESKAQRQWVVARKAKKAMPKQEIQSGENVTESADRTCQPIADELSSTPLQNSPPADIPFLPSSTPANPPKEEESRTRLTKESDEPDKVSSCAEDVDILYSELPVAKASVSGSDDSCSTVITVSHSEVDTDYELIEFVAKDSCDQEFPQSEVSVELVRSAMENDSDGAASSSSSSSDKESNRTPNQIRERRKLRRC